MAVQRIASEPEEEARSNQTQKYRILSSEKRPETALGSREVDRGFHCRRLDKAVGILQLVQVGMIFFGDLPPEFDSILVAARRPGLESAFS